MKVLPRKFGSFANSEKNLPQGRGFAKKYA